MIRYATGNLLDDPSEALVNPVNCVGVMGRGLAKEFKRGSRIITGRMSSRACDIRFILGECIPRGTEGRLFSTSRPSEIGVTHQS